MAVEKTYQFRMTGKDEKECLDKMTALDAINKAFTAELLIEFGAKIKDPKKVQKLISFKHLL